MTPEQLQTLRTEIDTDPNAVAEALNAGRHAPGDPQQRIENATELD